MNERVQKLLVDAQALYLEGKYSEADSVYQNILELDPECADAYFKLGVIHQKSNQVDEAEDSYRMAIHYDPAMADAYNNLGNLLRVQGEFSDACLLFQRSIELRKNFSEAYFNLGMTKNAMGKLDEALINYQTAIEFNPADESAYNNMGLILLNGKGQIKEAESCFRKAIEINADLYDAKVNLSLALQSKGDLEGAIDYYDKLIAEKDDAETRFHRSIAHLLNGDFKKGWGEYHHRWTSKVAISQQFPYPEWDGTQLLNDKTLLIYTEQGLGDEIMFASCLPDIIVKTKHCVIDCDPRMSPIFKRSFPSIKVHGGKKKQPDLKWLKEFEPIDFQIPIGDLPKYFRNHLPDFPKHLGYLKADPQRVDYWKERLAKLGQGLKVGISWQGGLVETRKDIRSIPLDNWSSILQMPSINFISLQYTDCQSEIDQISNKYGVQIHHWKEAINDYSETAALVCTLDLVISVCTSIVHLSGSLGKPAFVLVPAIPEWRYLQQGRKMPWYPSIQLFRQSLVGEWSDVLRQVEQKLKSDATRRFLT